MCPYHPRIVPRPVCRTVGVEEWESSMDRCAPPAGRLRSGRLATLSLVAILVVAACGSPAAGAGGPAGGANVDTGKIIAETQAIIGTSMVSGEVQGDTIVITMVDIFGAGGAGLFMCSNIRVVRDKYDPAGTMKMVMVNESGKELANSAACK
jgi:hypothetical protein